MNEPKVNKNFLNLDLYTQHRSIVENYLEKKIKKDYDLGLNTSYFKVNGEWLEEAAISCVDNKGYMIKTDELLKFAKIRKFKIGYLKEKVGLCKKNEATGILVFF